MTPCPLQLLWETPLWQSPSVLGELIYAFLSNRWRNLVENFPSPASTSCLHTALKGSHHPQLVSTVVSRSSELTQLSEVNTERFLNWPYLCWEGRRSFIHLFPDVLFCRFSDWLTGYVHRALGLGLFCHAIHRLERKQEDRITHLQR